MLQDQVVQRLRRRRQHSALAAQQRNVRLTVGVCNVTTRRPGYEPACQASLGATAMPAPAATSPTAVELRCTS